MNQFVSAQHAKISQYNLVEPFYVNIAINLNEYYNPTYKKNEPFKYHVAVLVSKIKVSLDQHIARDLVQFTACSE